jgi:U3 small nucleolar RNA-associated protein 13
VKFINGGTQLVSGSADGLIRLWTIRSGECENTFDNHQDKVWTICLNPDNEKQFFTGGSDSRVLVWKDETENVEQDRLLEVENSLLMEQQLFNDIRSKKYGKALKTALSLGHSNKILMIFTSILEEDKAENENFKHSDNELIIDFDIPITERLDKFIKVWTDDEIEKISSYLKEWNTNSRYCYISQVLINCLIRVIKIDRLLKIGIFSEAIKGLLSYSDRHYNRVDKLHQSSYIIEYMSSLMTLLPIDNDKTLLADKEYSRKSRRKFFIGDDDGDIDVNNNIIDKKLVLFSKTNVVYNDDSDDEEIIKPQPKKRKGAILVDDPFMFA